MLFPENREQVEAIVAKAREEGKALVPLSSGAPHLHGASVNPQAETVCFSRMDKIMKIDRRSRYARVEAGVTFDRLIPALAEAGMRLNAPFLPRQISLWSPVCLSARRSLFPNINMTIRILC